MTIHNITRTYSNEIQGKIKEDYANLITEYIGEIEGEYTIATDIYIQESGKPSELYAQFNNTSDSANISEFDSNIDELSTTDLIVGTSSTITSD